MQVFRQMQLGHRLRNNRHKSIITPDFSAALYQTASDANMAFTSWEALVGYGKRSIQDIKFEIMSHRKLLLWLIQFNKLNLPIC